MTSAIFESCYTHFSTSMYTDEKFNNSIRLVKMDVYEVYNESDTCIHTPMDKAIIRMLDRVFLRDEQATKEAECLFWRM